LRFTFENIPSGNTAVNTKRVIFVGHGLIILVCISFNLGRASGVDVMITIFGEKIGVLLKNQSYDQIIE
jgi:hypothetical protein